MIYIDENGKKWKAIGPHPDAVEEKLIIPIESKKWEVVRLNIEDLHIVKARLCGVSKAQAEAIKDCVEAVLDYIMVTQSDSTWIPSSVTDAIKTAHQVIRGENTNE